MSYKPWLPTICLLCLFCWLIFLSNLNVLVEEAVTRHFELAPPPRSAPSLQCDEARRHESMPWDEGRQGCQGCQGCLMHLTQRWI